MKDILLVSSSPALVKALEENLHGHLPLFGRTPCSKLWQEPGFLAFLTNLDSSECHVYFAQFKPEEVETLKKLVVGHYRSKGCLPMFWQVGPSTLPVDLGKYLEACGFQFSFGRQGWHWIYPTWSKPQYFRKAFLSNRSERMNSLKSGQIPW